MKIILGSLFIIIFVLSSFVAAFNKVMFRLFQFLLLLFGLLLIFMIPAAVLYKFIFLLLLFLSLMFYQLYWQSVSTKQTKSLLHSGLFLFLVFSVLAAQTDKALSFIPALLIYGFICFVSCQLSLFLFKNNFMQYHWFKWLKKRSLGAAKTEMKDQRFYFILFFFNLFSVIFYLYLTLTHLDEERTKVLISAYFLYILFALILDLLASSMERQQKQSLFELEFEGLKQYTTELEKSLFHLQGFRHDYLNVLTCLEESIAEEDIAGIKTVFQTVILPSKTLLTGNQDIFLKLNILKPELKSLLTSKLAEIITKNIMVKLSLKTDLENTGIRPLDLIRILSILIDNAKEEAEKMDNSSIEICFSEEVNGYEIVISNSLHTQISDVQELYTANVSRKNGHAGLGLSILTKIMEDYPTATLTTKILDEKFIQTLFILSEVKP